MDRYPAFRLFIIFALGISLGQACDIPILFIAVGIISSLIAIRFFGRSKYSSWLWIIILLSSGWGWQTVRRQAAGTSLTPGEHSLVARVKNEPQQGAQAWTFLAEAVAFSPDSVLEATAFKVLVRLPEDLNLKPEYGDIWYLRGRWQPAGRARNPGGFDYGEYLEKQEVSGLFSASEARALGKKRGDWLTAAIIIPLRQRIRQAINSYLDGDPASLLSGLLLGERRHLSERVRAAFSDTGTAHVLAVSGLHVGLVALILIAFLRACRLPKRAGYIASMVGLGLYAWLTGGSPSVVRATIMAVAVMVGLLNERRGSGLNMLGLAGMVILCFWPQALATPGFQLSFAATFGILVLAPRLQILASGLGAPPLVKNWILMPLAVSAAAQLATAPIIAWYFHRVPLISLLANLIVVPLAGAVLSLGLAAVLASAIHHGLAGPMMASAYGASWLMLKAVDLFSGWGRLAVAWPRPDYGQISIYLLILSLLFAWSRLGRWRFRVAVGLLALANLIIWKQALAGPPPLQIYYLDVGQGDAAVIKFPNGRVMAIDAGQGGESQAGAAGRRYDAGRKVIVPFLRYLGISTIDDFLITHADADHCGGLAAVLEAVRIKRLITTQHFSSKPLYVEALRTAEHKGVRIDSLCGYDTLDGIWPVRGFIYSRPDTVENGNESSLICYLRYGDEKFFFSGDMGPELQGHLYRQGLLTPCTVLKVPHHGARHNNGPGLARAIRPESAVISVGEHNRFGHPSPQALSNYSHIGARVWRTDHQGAVIIDCHGQRCRISSMLAP